MSIDWNRLTAPFAPEDVEWKPGATTRDKKKGLAMAYITARTIQERLDEVFGPGGWKNEFRPGPTGGVICRIYFRTGETLGDGSPEWAWREGGAENTDVEAIKGGLSNAMKRAGSALGIGRYLYKLPQQWVALDERGRFAQTPRIPREFLPEGGARAGGARPASSEPFRQPTPRTSRPAGGNPSTDVRQSASRPQPRAGQKKVVRRVGGREVPSGDGANRPHARPF